MLEGGIRGLRFPDDRVVTVLAGVTRVAREGEAEQRPVRVLDLREVDGGDLPWRKDDLALDREEGERDLAREQRRGFDREPAFLVYRARDRSERARQVAEAPAHGLTVARALDHRLLDLAACRYAFLRRRIGLWNSAHLYHQSLAAGTCSECRQAPVFPARNQP